MKKVAQAKKSVAVKKTVSKKPATKEVALDSNHPILKDLEAKLGTYLKKTLSAGKSIEHVRKNAVGLIKEGENKAKKEVREIETLIKKHPAASILVASAVGAGLGVVAGVAGDKAISKPKKASAKKKASPKRK